jgi:hypothetical protein
MSTPLTRSRVIQFWFVAVAVAAAAGVAFGVTIGMSTGVLLVAGCLVPPAVLFVMWRDAPPTVAELLNAEERRG